MEEGCKGQWDRQQEPFPSICKLLELKGGAQLQHSRLAAAYTAHANRS